MAKITVRFRQGPDLVIEAADFSWDHKEGSHIPIIYVRSAEREFLAVIPADAVEAVYMTDAAKEAASA